MSSSAERSSTVLLVILLTILVGFFFNNSVMQNKYDEGDSDVDMETKSKQNKTIKIFFGILIEIIEKETVRLVFLIYI